MKRKNFTNTPRKADILRLRAEGKSYREIEEELNCSRSTISYHCGNGNEKTRVMRNNKKRTCLARKVNSFKSQKTSESVRIKLKGFKSRGSSGKGEVNNISKNYTVKDVINKLSLAPICYLTGREIDINDGSTYHLDHIIPTSKGGTNDLSNLGICIADANIAKGSLPLEEFYSLCEEILAWRDRSVNTKKPNK